MPKKGATAAEAFREDDPAIFLGRDPSWLRFDERVLARAEDPRVPLFERLSFLVITASNLDEYFMKRVAGMKRRLRSGVEVLSHDGKTVREQYDESREKVLRMAVAMSRCHAEQILPGLADEGIEVVPYRKLSKARRQALDAWFHANAYPILTPLAVDRGQRFPFVSNLSQNIGVLVSQPGDRVRLFARLKIPSALPSYVPVPEAAPKISGKRGRRRLRFVHITEIVEANLGLVFPGMTIADSLAFRITRSTGVEAEDDEGGDILESVEAYVRRRRFAEPVRIEVQPGASAEILDLLLDELDLDLADVYERPGPLEYADLRELARLETPELRLAAWSPVTPPRLIGHEQDVFGAIRERDLLVHHPYESFEDSVERFITEAADDPQVLAIKQTLYRTTSDSPFVRALVRAAQTGKQVACLVELRARFDEDRNLELVRILEKNGVHVTYGIVGVKTHCKLALVVRREGEGLQSYVHVGTGNYHPVTARLYTDTGLFTCDRKIANDVTNVFNYLTGRSLHHRYQKLIVAPVGLRDDIYRRIDAEIQSASRGRPARIIAKMNQLEDRGVIARLYAASAAGVRITLLIRGFCCLKPGVPGLSENIRVVSVVGRFLEHSRLFHFAAGEADPIDGDWMMGSADWMRRNIDERVEVLVPVDDRAARRRLLRIVEVSIRDHSDAWELQPDGSYRRLRPEAGADPESPEVLGTFESLCRDALVGEAPKTASDYFLTAEADEASAGAPPDTHESAARRCLKILVERPWLTGPEALDSAGVPSSSASAVRRHLGRLGLVVAHRIGRLALWEPTAEAFDRIESDPEVLAGEESFPRRWVRARILADSERARNQVDPEIALDEVRPDVVLGKPGKRETWLVVGEGAASAAEARRMIEADSGKVRLIALDAAHLKELRKLVKKSGGEAEVLSMPAFVELTRPGRKRRVKKRGEGARSGDRKGA